MSRKMPLEAEDLDVLYDRIWRQVTEDRDSIKEVFDDLKCHILKDKHLYDENGDTIAKLSDVMIKQTGQLMELIKLAQKSKEQDDRLSEEDFEKIHEEIKND